MLTSANTEQRIIQAMEHGAQLVFHWWMEGTWSDPVTGISLVTLERNGQVLRLSEDVARDWEWFYCLRRDNAYLRNPHGRDYSGRELARRLADRAEVRREYAGYRGDYDKTWRELYVHQNTPTPRWVTEQWYSPVERSDPN